MENSLNILIADDMHPCLMEGLQKAEIQFSYIPSVNDSELLNFMQTHNALIVRGKIKADKAFMEACPKLYFVARAGAGMDNIDEEAANQLGIHCFNAGAGNRDAVGEHTIGMLLNLAANINKSHQEVAKGIWDREGNRGFEIGSCTIGIIGFGNTGSAVAQKLSGFGCRVLAYDKYVTGFGSELVEEVALEALLQECNVITFHVPLTSETEDWINDKFIQSVQKPFVLLNLSRGGIMKTEDVLDGLNNKKIIAFGTDVLENEHLETYSTYEKEIFNKLLQNTNVCVTPHIGGWTVESYKRISEVLLKNIVTFRLNHQGFLTQFNKEQHFV